MHTRLLFWCVFYIKHPLRYTITYSLYHKSTQLYSFIINKFYNNAGLKYKQLVLKNWQEDKFMKTNLKKCNLTTAAWLDEWFAQYVIPKTRVNTQTCYKRFIDVINDYLGEIPLSELTSSDIQQLVFNKYRNNLR